jgi:hypothetical protein
MSDFDYGAFPVRDDIRAAHRALWEHIRSPGSWWSGAQRVAIAAEARDADACELCAARKAALSPAAVQGEHRSTGTLPPNVVEVIHRVRADPARLSRPWFDTVIAGGPAAGVRSAGPLPVGSLQGAKSQTLLGVAPYVELLGVVTMLTGVDYFARALGLAPFPLPEPVAGAPSHHVPVSAKPGTAWVPMIAPEDACGPEADLYPAGAMIPNIVRALSLVPAEVRMLLTMAAAHYLRIEQLVDPMARRSLDRLQIELVAARVSALNQCFY